MAPTKLMKSMKQFSLAEIGFLPKASMQTRKAVLLSEMEQLGQPPMNRGKIQ